jgi:predicted GIY-YIG superfamily endonuclease
MRDAAEKVVYVGKARDLKRRLQNYRIANPDKMPRRHLRMVREVARIEFQFCPSESAALKRESKLLRSLKPKFNRAGVWPGKTRFLVWRRAEERLDLGVMDVPEAGWQRHGPLGGNAMQLQRTLACLLWLAVNPGRAFAELPPGWAQGKFAEPAAIRCGGAAEEVGMAVAAFFWQSQDGLLHWLQRRLAERTHPFERSVIAGELELLRQFAARHGLARKSRRQLPLL